LFKVIESRLEFRFDDSWLHMCKWDDSPAFQEGLKKLQTSAAVDFVGLHGSEPYFIEVKNFRDHRIANKRRLTSGELVAEVADKVRDSLAGLVWAMERRCQTPDLAALVRHVFAARSKCKVVLWLEEDPQPRPADRSMLAEAIKRRLRWLEPHVAVISRRDPALPGIEVTGA
jgi:hypothetical protein